jgi:hypothetical protein
MMEKKAQLTKSPHTPPERVKKVAEEKKVLQKDPAADYVKKAPGTPMLDTASMLFRRWSYLLRFIKVIL